jgi:ribosomal protein L40E
MTSMSRFERWRPARGSAQQEAEPQEQETTAIDAVTAPEQPTTEAPALGAVQPPPATEPSESPTPPPDAAGDAEPPQEDAPAEEAPRSPGFGQRSRLRRRLRYLRQARELAFRDLGGFIFDAHRFSRERPDIVRAKLDALDDMDRELRSIETALDERRDVTVLREAGIAVCARCGSLHGSDARYCPRCGLQVGARVDLPVGPPAPPPQS